MVRSVFIETPARHQSIALVLQSISNNNTRSVLVGMGMQLRVADNTMNEMIPQSTKVWGVNLKMGAGVVHWVVLSFAEPKNRATSVSLVSEQLIRLFGANSTGLPAVVCLVSTKHS